MTPSVPRTALARLSAEVLVLVVMMAEEVFSMGMPETQREARLQLALAIPAPLAPPVSCGKGVHQKRSSVRHQPVRSDIT